MAEDFTFGMKCIKYILLSTCIMFGTIGFLLVSIGSTVQGIYTDFEHFMDAHYFSVSTLVICIGVVIFLISIFGCIGAIKGSTCITKLFAMLLSVVLIMEIAVVFAAYTMRHNIKSAIRVRMETSMDYYSMFSYETKTWDFMQEHLQCCGINNYTDWNLNEVPSANDYNAMLTVQEVKAIPGSCCIEQSSDGIYCIRIWGTGCVDALSSLVSQCTFLIACGAATIAFIQVLGIVFANILAKAIRRNKTQKLVEANKRRQEICEKLVYSNEQTKSSVLLPDFVSEASNA